MCRLAALFLLASASLCAGGTEPLAKYFIAFLYKGPKFAALPSESPERKANHEQHIAYIARMLAEGKLLTYGPILDAGDLRGLYVFRAESVEQAREFANQEPSVKIGMIEMRVYPWLGPVSLFPPKTPDR
ncbi:MAG: YciI family protein [Acidobacteriota bacterium]